MDFEQIANDYMLMLLNWAYKKIGDRDKAEDLTQEVLLGIFTAIRKSDSEIMKPDHFVWKIAHYTWCNYLRKKECSKMCISIDDSEWEFADDYDFAEQYVEEEEQKELILRMRRQISRLNYLQREIMISFYIEELSVREIAEKHQMTEAAVKWHLFSVRKKLKKEIGIMGQKDYVYRPKRMHMGISGIPALESDTKVVNISLTMQNICMACYHQPKTPEELSEILGIPTAYVENDLNWLLKREFVAKAGSSFSTAFIIQSNSDKQGEYAVFLKYKDSLLSAIVDELAAAEDSVRAIGFYGCDKPFDKLLWLLIYKFCGCLDILQSMEPPVRVDGGKYFPLGFETSGEDRETQVVLDTSGWAFNGSMGINGFNWFGLYNFGNSEIVDVISNRTEEGRNLQCLLRKLIAADFRFSEEEEQQKFTLAQLVQKGYVTVEKGVIRPEFCIFTADQYRQLYETVFQPIMKKLEMEWRLLTADMEEYCKAKLPSQLKHLYGMLVRLSLYDITFLTTFLAFQDGRLYKPVDKEDGEFLTLMYTKE